MNFSVSADILAELLEVAINLILYTREIYPAAAFKRTKKYNSPVQMCIHPGVSAYISNCVGSIKPVLEKGEVEKVVVAIITENGTPVEKFVFEIKQTPLKPQKIKEDPKLIRMEENLRAFCLKLSISDSLLRPLPGQCSFAIHLHVPEHAQLEMTTSQQNQSNPWVELDKEQMEVADPVIVALKNLKSEVCQMQLYVEESSTAKE